jgi:hypothetical protein
MSIKTTVVAYQKEADLVSTMTESYTNATILYQGPQQVDLAATVEKEIPVPTGSVGVILSKWTTTDDLAVGGTSGQYGPTLPTDIGLPCVLPLIAATSIFLYTASGGSVNVRFV